ncbi:helix-turn-helix domain-containing protein [Erwiniaceae bacterium BAC15a-03b]|uniref:Helix-turn-helix domain-containing protein n=1 Tax=Winslowiella arboricola TaxID=2978220 RepID=A0A9J6PQS8_9GAMM|nr:helix-turn-helix transcriptional regulator [Winslowiella arboricola]MCU5772899.1 helix-turn-helix domain-containing protein [Winslowiella arboricola]MCU5780673.1 helix-turn-helix domain-containing protein [Winslowiella arboricola]
MKDRAADSARDTINRIRAKQNSVKQSAGTVNATTSRTDIPSAKKSVSRQRASGLSQAITVDGRNTARLAIIKALLLGEMTQGEALKTLRIDVLGLKQESFARLVSVSRKTLSEVENDKGNYTSDIINKLFKPFGLQVGLVPTSRHMLATLFTEQGHIDAPAL